MIEISHLDLNCVTHCNFRCTSCSHASPLAPPWSMPLEMIEHDLTVLKSVLHPRSINIVGGEPTLHKEIVEVLRVVKRIRIGDVVTVITNGSLLHRMPDAFWNELEYLNLSIYPTLDMDNVRVAEEKSKEFGFGMASHVFTEFYNQLKETPDDGIGSFKDCHWKTNCFTVHRGFFYLCSQSAFFPNAVLNLPRETDGLTLEGITEEKLQAFMDRKEPFESCKMCRANEMKASPWRESARKEWVQDSKKS